MRLTVFLLKLNNNKKFHHNKNNKQYQVIPTKHIFIIIETFLNICILLKERALKICLLP